jgi:hypothetical protein
MEKKQESHIRKKPIGAIAFVDAKAIQTLQGKEREWLVQNSIVLQGMIGGRAMSRKTRHMIGPNRKSVRKISVRQSMTYLWSA